MEMHTQRNDCIRVSNAMHWHWHMYRTRADITLSASIKSEDPFFFGCWCCCCHVLWRCIIDASATVLWPYVHLLFDVFFFVVAIVSKLILNNLCVRKLCSIKSIYDSFVRRDQPNHSAKLTLTTAKQIEIVATQRQTNNSNISLTHKSSYAPTMHSVVYSLVLRPLESPADDPKRFQVSTFDWFTIVSGLKWYGKLSAQPVGTESWHGKRHRTETILDHSEAHQHHVMSGKSKKKKKYQTAECGSVNEWQCFGVCFFNKVRWVRWDQMKQEIA